MIANGNPWKLKIKPKMSHSISIPTGTSFMPQKKATTGSRWVALGHGVPIDAPRFNQPIDPKIDGKPFGDSMRLQGVEG
jgi:hypothetical protein